MQTSFTQILAIGTTLLAAISLCPDRVSAQDRTLPKIGRAAPVFTAKDQDGKTVRIGGKSETWTVLAFYPKALTPG